MIDLVTPLQSLHHGHWFKLICGASYQHLPAVRNLVLAYTLAGADCIDVAADPAVIRAAQAAIATAIHLNPNQPRPLLMVSLNDGEDPHFRKASLSPEQCPTDCPQPCASLCPADAIAFPSPGVIADRCYGCGRCLPVCPIEQIATISHRAKPEIVGPFIQTGVVQALEIHTQVGREAEFKQLWQALKPFVPHLQVLAVSCPDGDGLLDYLANLFQLMAPLPCALIWQTDGRPMSGDIGDGTTRATVLLAEKVLQAQLPGFVQLAGGTNRHTIAKLKAKGLLHPRLISPSMTIRAPHIAGVAYGSFARQLLAPIQTQLEPLSTHHLEDHASLLREAVSLAASLIAQLKTSGLNPPQATLEPDLPFVQPMSRGNSSWTG
ncbi:circadian clock protein LdpA [Acaryochloris sp. IP29b_bin.137]|uniref:circadian clock protein LdpA n=1 Tax=Acaryochloris sp. IP29b_bin.137 TaxID=2969217 RepID=UPI002622E2BF|nr:LdpA C-terminal domain-containing domain [Acaryochloris sp. IP29b_bin.137]